MFLRPNLYTSYEQEAQIFPTWTKKILALVAIVVLFLMPFSVPVINQIPIISFLGSSGWLRPMSTAFIFVIAALGLNILIGLAGQISLGHAFFMGVGAYAGAVVGGESTRTVWGWGFPIWIWLPAAGLVAAAIGLIIAPVAVRLRGLYLAIVTLGLVFIGIHMSNTTWGRRIAGDPGLGRDFPNYDIRLWREDDPLVSLSTAGQWLWFDVSAAQKRFLFLALLMIVFMVLAKNIARSRTGRALQAIRDRDIAAEVMGVHEFKYKLIAFGISSFFAGVAGALWASLAGKLPAEQFSLFLSIEFIAILLIGGIGTVTGVLMGTFFVELSPKFVEEFTRWLSQRQDEAGVVGIFADLLLSRGPGDFGPISIATQSPGWPLNVFDWNIVLYGVLIIVFLIFEPLGLYGIWVKVRNYWKRWPFSY
jgi:branched-chain amino acid transport system permease protein